MPRHLTYDENGEKVFIDYTDEEFAVLNPATLEEVKIEAHRRIVAIVPEWKQRNLLAQAALLTDKGRENWTAEETADWDAALVIWAQVAAIRARSDEIEAMDPIPHDMIDDRHWP